MITTIENEGKQLKHWINRTPITKKKFIEKMGFSSYNNLSHYLKQDRIKLTTLNKFCQALGITIDQFYEGPDKKVTEKSITSTKKVSHNGEALKAAITKSGMKATTLATRMGISRGTLYNWFDQKEIDLGTLLHIAQVLNISVAELKGVGTGQQGFERDIYLQLEEINKKIDLLLQK